MKDTIDPLPSYRFKNQQWVLYLHESSAFSPNFEKYKNLFNLSATYRLDSNFTSLYYINYIWAKNESFDENRDFSKNKTDFAAIIVSNCGY
jgi:hypothetical protein